MATSDPAARERWRVYFARLCKSKGYDLDERGSRARLAEGLDVNASTITQWVRNPPKNDSAIKLAKFFGVPERQVLDAALGVTHPGEPMPVGPGDPRLERLAGILDDDAADPELKAWVDQILNTANAGIDLAGR